jgi:hypothetical protein
MSGNTASILAAGLVLAAACSSPRAGDGAQEPAQVASTAETSMAAAPAAPASAPAAAGPETAALPTMTVYKSPTCGCCKNWIDHVKAAGFAVEVHDLDDLSEIKAEAGVPDRAQSCHTAIVDGYAIEGHVPAETIKRLIKERPKVAGLAVPGMPVGSPGMEVPGQAADKYDIVAFDRKGTLTVYESR